MKTLHVNMSIADYCGALARTEVTVDRTYQRSPRVWPGPARSFLIETILKDFPIPKLALHQVTDLTSKKTVKYVVDGQQRTTAIRDFFDDRLALSRSIELREAAGRKYSELDEDLQGAFLSYSLQFDQFESASDNDVREYFRRINSFTAPLNAEEQRHARYQGAMKWFINSLSTTYGATLEALGVLPAKTIVRMGDAKFFSEVVHALLNGYATTSKSLLDKMYAQFEREDSVPDEQNMRRAIDDAFNLIASIPAVSDSSLARLNVFYSLLLACILVQKDWKTLHSASPVLGKLSVSTNAEYNLLELAAALEEPEQSPDLREFTDAAADRTNVKDQRETRVRWLTTALSQDELT